MDGEAAVSEGTGGFVGTHLKEIELQFYAAHKARVIAVVTATAVATGSLIGMAQASAVPAQPAPEAVQVADDPAIEQAQQKLESALAVVEGIPDEVIEAGDDAVAEYLEQHGAPARGIVTYGFWDVAKCVAAITVAIGGAAVPVAKVLKIKALIKAVGGVKKLGPKVVEVVKKVKNGQQLGPAVKEVFSSFGATVVGLAAEVLGIDAIISNCA